MNGLNRFGNDGAKWFQGCLHYGRGFNRHVQTNAVVITIMGSLFFKGFVPVLGAFEHLLPGLHVDQIEGVLAGPELPAAAERFV